MVPLRRLGLAVACASLVSCGNPALDCGADPVMQTLASLVREQVLRAAFDTVAYGYDAERKAAFKKATRVTADDAELVAWDQELGRLTCTARVIIDAPESSDRPNAKTVRRFGYRVSGGDDGMFFVEMSFEDLARIGTPQPAGSGRSL